MGKDKGPAVPTKGFPTWGGIARSLWVLLAADHTRIKTEIPHLRTWEIPAVQRAYRVSATLTGFIIVMFAVLLAKTTGDWAMKVGFCIGVLMCIPVAITAVWLYLRHDERKRLKEEGE